MLLSRSTVVAYRRKARPFLPPPCPPLMPLPTARTVVSSYTRRQSDHTVWNVSLISLLLFYTLKQTFDTLFFDVFLISLYFLWFNTFFNTFFKYFFEGIELGSRVPSNLASNTRPNKRQRGAGLVREDVVAMSPVLFEQRAKVMGDLTSEVSEILNLFFWFLASIKYL